MNEIWNLTKKSRLLWLLAIVCSTLGILFNLLMPQVIRLTVDSVIGSEPLSSVGLLVTRFFPLETLRQNLIICGALVVLAFFFYGVFNFSSRALMSRATEGFIYRFRRRLFSHIARLPFSWFDRNQTGDIIQRCTADLDVVRNFCAAQMMDALRTVLLVALSLFIMFSMNAALSLIVLAFIPVILLYSVFFYGRIAERFKVADESEGALMNVVQENLTGVRVVRAFGQEKQELSRFDEKNNLHAKLWIDLGYVLGSYWGVGDIVTYLLVLAVLVCGCVMAVKGTLTVGELLVFISYSQTLAWPVRGLGRTLSEMSKTGVSLKRLLDILNSPKENNDGLIMPEVKGSIRFEDVTFAYLEEKVLDGLSFTVHEGETLGILGATGSGKSTIGALLTRLYDLPKDCGLIELDGFDIQAIDRPYLRRNVGLILQEPFLFSRTIAENIDIEGKHTIEEVRQVAQNAAVDENILSFEQGYETMVGERGVTLSGGQKQRIAIARTLLLKPKVVIFDDSMSAVDMETDAKIRDAITNELSATVLLISHRISTLMQADRILVLEEGKAAQIGTHEELLAVEGTYRRTYHMQGGSEHA